jgi:hypothetical protein
MKYEHDRGAFDILSFKRCARGFTLDAREMHRDWHATFAFDHIEDLAAWLVEQYAQWIEAGTDETTQLAQPEGREPDGEADAPKETQHDEPKE